LSQRKLDSRALATLAAAAASGLAASRARRARAARLNASVAVAEPSVSEPVRVPPPPTAPARPRARAGRRPIVAATIVAVAVLGAVAEKAIDDPSSSDGLRASITAADLSKLPRDPEAASAFPEPASSPEHPLARTPEAAAADAQVSEGAPSDAQVRRELRELERLVGKVRLHQGGAPNPARLARDGTVNAPSGAPSAVAEAIAGGNAIARFPYRFGGGHGSFVDNAYDCSGSVSYALAAAGLLDAPLASGELARWGEPGAGEWITVYANGGHVFMEVAGVRFDTSGRSGRRGSRWQGRLRSTEGFVARHWPGL
jgi:cell wall-associated NlpC family hydrolase